MLRTRSPIVPLLMTCILSAVIAGCGEVAPPTPPPVVSPSPATPAPTSEPGADPSPTPSPAVPSPSPGQTASPSPPPVPVIKASARLEGDTLKVRGAILADGVPLADVPVRISVQPLDGRPQRVVLQGTVPPGAVAAHVGIRVNTEGIIDVGPARISIYQASYVQGGGTRNRVLNANLRDSTIGWGLHGDGIGVRRSDIGPGLMVAIRDRARQQTIINTNGFRVTPGKPYRATMLLRVSESTAGHAYFSVIWLSDVTEIERARLTLVAEPFDLPDPQTQADGRFRGLIRDLEPGRYRVRVEYAGDRDHPGAAWEQVVRVG